jgi:nitrate reductase cytochrome c-type subunit
VNDQVYFYYPITTNAKCLQCHGVKERDIQPPVLTVLSTLYPEDKATGYEVDEVRGMWKVQFIEEE